jgi:hypothetical protein
MNTKTVAIEMDSGDEVEIEIEWSYSSDPGRQYMPNGDPGYPAEEETEIVLPKDLDQVLIDYFKANVMPEWIKTIEKRCTLFECDGDVTEWARDLKEEYECDREDY